MGWYKIRMTWAGGGDDAAALAMAGIIARADGQVLAEREFRDVSVTPWQAEFTLEASSVSDAWIQAMVVLNRAAAVAGMPPRRLSGVSVQAGE